MLPGTLYRKASNSRAEGITKTKSPESSVSKGDVQQDGLSLSGKLVSSGEGRCGREEGTGTEPNPAPVGGGCFRTCSWCGSVAMGVGRRLGGRLPAPGESCSWAAKEQEARGHCSSSEDSWEMPSYSSFSSFLVSSLELE